MHDYKEEYRNAIAQKLHCTGDDLFFYWKGRVALYALLKTMDIGAEDEVIVQGYTCVVVSNAILYLGATPVYADIDQDTYNVNLESLKAKITEKTKVIICQNTYGLSTNLEAIARIAEKATAKYHHKVFTIEDCTHGFGGTYHGIPNGTSCDASFFSTQWSKPYTTGVGGFCVAHNKEIKSKLELLNKDLIAPSINEKIELELMYFIRKYIITDLTYWPMIRLYRWMSKNNLVVGSSSGEELSGIAMPEGFFKAQSVVQYKRGIKALKKLDAANMIRKQNAEKYTEFLMSHGKRYVGKDVFDDHIFIRYPLLVKEREKFRKEAENSKIILGEWFEAPVYPVYTDLKLWKVNEKDLPNSMYICEHIVNLPTEEKNTQKVIDFLSKHLSMII